MELTHSTRSLRNSDDVLSDVLKHTLSERELEALIARKVESFRRDRQAATRSKAVQYVDTMDEVQRVQYSRKRTPHWFVTVNPKPGVTIETLHNRVVDLLSREEIRDPTWCYEIRKAPAEGLHAHILFTCNTNDKNYADRKVKALFVPDLCQLKRHVHIKWIPSCDVEATRQYIIKSYTSKSKEPADVATRAWRLENGIPFNMNEDHLLVWSELTQLTQ